VRLPVAEVPPSTGGNDGGSDGSPNPICGPMPTNMGCTNASCDGPGSPIDPICNAEGTWTCPSGPDLYCPPPDGGGCTGPAPSIWCSDGCGDSYLTQATCSYGSWTCPLLYGPVCIIDAGPYDGWPVWDGQVDANPPPPPNFACGDLACNPSTSYCTIDTGGPVQEDGGVGSYYSCNALPTSCDAGAASCACVQAYQGVSPGCGCVEENGDVIITCAVP
jgi:hypothetical protein